MYNPTAVGVAATENTLTLTPWMRDSALGTAYATALTNGVSGAVDWGCATETAATAGQNNITVVVPGNALRAKYAPAICR